MFDFAFFYYVIVCSIAILLNTFIVCESLGKSIRGEFKWVFLGSALTNLLLAVSQLILMPTVLKWPGKNEFSLIVTANPLLFGADNKQTYEHTEVSSLCSTLFSLFYFRQLEASVLSIALVPLNRAFAVCWKHISLSNGKMWILIAAFPNLLPFVIYAITRRMESTTTSDLDQFPPKAIQLLEEHADQAAYCTLNSNYRTAGDTTATVFLILCPIISYPIAMFCVCKLLMFVRASQESVRSTVSHQVLQRQKGILVTIGIQAAAPLVIYLPLFLSILLVDNSWGMMESDTTNWYPMSAVHFTIAWGPPVDAAATILCIKPYRRAFLNRFRSVGSDSVPAEPGMFQSVPPEKGIFQQPARRASDTQMAAFLAPTEKLAPIQERTDDCGTLPNSVEDTRL